MTNILNAQVPSQRWALPSDDDRDRYENQYDRWISDHYDEKSDTVLGVPYAEAWDSDDLFDQFMDEVRYEQAP